MENQETKNCFAFFSRNRIQKHGIYCLRTTVDSYLLHDLHISVSLPISVIYDNQVAIHTASNPIFHEGTKHLGIDCHLVR